MSGILVIAETRRGEVRDVSLELITAARGVKDAAGGRLAVAVVGADPSAYADRLNVEDVDELLLVASPTEHFEAHVADRALQALIDAEQPSLVLLGHTIDSMGFAPAVAARRNLGFASDVMTVGWDGDGPVVTRGAYGDKLVAELEFPGKDCTVVMVRAGAFEPAEGAGQAATREVDADLADASATEHVDFREAAVGDVDITKAEFLLSVGRGVEDKDNLPQFEELAEKMGATLSVSRPIVDAGWMSNARQVGQSGKTVKPKVYLALGISGAVQHLAGMSKADTIIAVNTDPEAPIFNVAHYGVVADMFDVAEELEQQFSQ
jgi:electron transfer flavoprotein alpha subunit